MALQGGGTSDLDLANSTYHTATLSVAQDTWVNTNISASGVKYMYIQLNNRSDYFTIAVSDNDKIVYKIINWSDIKIENGYFWFYEKQSSGTQTFNIIYYT